MRPPLLCLVLVLFGLVAAWPALEGGYVYDDEYYLVQNPAVTGSASAWSRPLGEDSQGLFRPITVLSWRWLWRGPEDAGLQRLANLLLHLGAALLVVAVARGLGWSPRAGAVAGLLFAVHPVHAEAVAWVTGRAELLAAVFVLLGWLAHLRPSRWALVGSSLALVLGVLGKETAYAAPLFWAAADLATGRDRRTTAWRLGVHGLVLAGLWAWREAVIPQALPAAGPYLDLDLVGRAGVALAILARGLLLLTVPHPLRVEYQRDEFLGLPGQEPALLLLVALVGVALILRRRCPGLGRGLLLVPLAMVTTLQLVPIGEPFAERFLYLPSVPFCLAVAAVWDGLCEPRRDGSRAAAAGLGLVLIVGLSLPLSRAACAVFRDDLTLWAHTARVAPELPLARYNHGAALHRAGVLLGRGPEAPGAADELWASLELRPHHIYAGFAHHTLGNLALGAEGTGPANVVSAAWHYRRALEEQPALTETRLNLAAIALTAPTVVGPGEARAVLNPLLMAPGLDPARVAAARELLAQLPARDAGAPSGSSGGTGTSSDEGS